MEYIDNTCNELKSAIAGEKDIYSNLLDFAKKKKEIIVNHRVNELNEIIRVETELVEQIRILDEKRITAIKDITRQTGDEETNDINAVLSNLSAPLREEMETLIKELKGVLRELWKLNHINQKLIETQLQYTAFCIEIMTQSNRAGDLYGSNGQVNPDNVNLGFVDRKV